MIENLIADLKVQEGFREKAYECPTGYITIGYGHNLETSNLSADGIKRYLQRGISQEEATLLLKDDVKISVKSVDRGFPWVETLPEPARRALYNMCFQLGFHGLSKFRKMLAALQEQDWEKAKVEAKDSRWYRQTPNRTDYVCNLFDLAKGMV